MNCIQGCFGHKLKIFNKLVMTGIAQSEHSEYDYYHGLFRILRIILYPENLDEKVSKMHEFSIALSIVEIAEKEVKKHNAERVESIEMEIGKLSGIEPMALEFAWDHAVVDTVLENAERKINYIKGRAICEECGKEFEIDFIYDECPDCHSYQKEFLSGKELIVKSLTLI
ncbi:MAG: hydrogenase maturation nickel metallochaperone HypA [Cyclobacteriaceae bacterium]|nr:hydrogenase maturation nickel metallochaperone HypA [Cyclobacteriaceae bacterium]